MAFLKSVALLCVLLSVGVMCRPRDSSIAHAHDIVLTDVIQSQSDIRKAETSTHKPAIEEVKIPGRVSCKYEEATEDDVCIEHCLPKGYAHGICVSNKCSCI